MDIITREIGLELEDYLQKEHERVMSQLARHKKQREFIPPEPELIESSAIESSKGCR